MIQLLIDIPVIASPKEIKQQHFPVDKWTEEMKSYHIGDMLNGTIVNVNYLGIFVSLDHATEITGLIHKSNLMEDFGTSFHTGDMIQVKIKDIKYDKHQIEFSLIET